MNNADRIDVQFLHFCLKNKLFGEGLIYLYYRRKGVNSCGLSDREESVCGMQYRQQLRYLNSLQSLGWIQLLPKNKIQIISVRRFRQDLGIYSRQVVSMTDYGLSSIKNFKTFCFSVLAESVARAQNKVVSRRKSRGVKYGPDEMVLPSREKSYTAAEVINNKIGHYKNQLSVRMIAAKLGIPFTSVQDLKMQAIEDGIITTSKQFIYLESKEDADALKYYGYYPSKKGDRFCLRQADEFRFSKPSIGKRRKDTSNSSTEQQVNYKKRFVMHPKGDAANRRCIVTLFHTGA